MDRPEGMTQEEYLSFVNDLQLIWDRLRQEIRRDPTDEEAINFIFASSDSERDRIIAKARASG